MRLVRAGKRGRVRGCEGVCVVAREEAMHESVTRVYMCR